MNKSQKVDSSRRSFFLLGGAALGSLAPASAVALVFHGDKSLKEQLAHLQERLNKLEDIDAIKGLQFAYHNLLENSAYDEVSELFTEDAELTLGDKRYRGKEINRLYSEIYREQQGEQLQTAFQLDPMQQQYEISVSVDRQSAGAVFHYQVEVSIPHEDESTLAEMARLQGQYASARWVKGIFDMAYRKEAGQWRISRLEFTA